MKHFYFLLLLMASAVYSAQSISASKMLFFVNLQNPSKISTELKKLGFLSSIKDKGEFTMYEYKKGSEYLTITRNDELFMVVYRPSYSAYSVLKSKLLTGDYVYAYNYKNNDYYENSKMRIGVNELNGIISLFKPLKK